MIIDAHHHLWDPATRRHDWLDGLPRLRRTFGLADYTRESATAGVTASVLIQVLASPAETEEFLATAAATAGQVPEVAGVVGWVDLTGDDVGGELDRLRAQPGGDRLVGVRHLVQDEPDPCWLTRREVQAGIAAVGAAGLAYDLLVTPAQLPAAMETVRRQPEVRFVLDHGAKPPIRAAGLEPWGRLIADLAAAPNVAVKLSGLVTEAPAHPGPDDLRPYWDRLLSAFGPDRVMFGSDWPVCLLACGYDRVVELAEQACTGLSAAEQAAVFGATAVRWYAIDQVEI